MLEHYPDLLTAHDVMEILDISKNTLYRLIRKQEIPAFRLGPKVWRFKREDLVAYLEGRFYGDN